VVLCSFHSISKGFYGECGRRGGYVEMVNTPKDVFAELVKLASIDLCSNINGQICTALMMQPPQVPPPPPGLMNGVCALTCMARSSSLYPPPRVWKHVYF